MTAEVLFDAQPLLSRLEDASLPLCKQLDISFKNPGKELKFRPLEISDYQKGYIELLSQLTKVGVVTEDAFVKQFRAMKASGVHYVFVVEDMDKDLIVGNATLAVEYKMTHSTCLRGRIEDVVVHNDYRGKHLGVLLVETLTILGKELGCYKISLDCTPDMIPYYKKFGFLEGPQVFMCQRFSD
ncbi:glucosamine 6-phosphate N-acetyltransferase-like [Dysidea avara]|uniref:glucosamine 6-phosphate N-acetyltransferase-like n=1 Tax=Dysidea avara TaxID=196820 RepID=UPI00331BC8E4